MARRAQVKSIEALQTMAVALDRFHGEAMAALDDLEMEVRRALEWLHDCKEYWIQEMRRAWERVAEARVQLQQAMTVRRIAEHQPSCIDEKRALEKAKRRVQVAQEKLAAVQHWTHAVHRVVSDYRASRGQLTGWLDADFPQALSALRGMRQALETYVATEKGTGPSCLKGPEGAAHKMDLSPLGTNQTEEQQKPCEPGT